MSETYFCRPRHDYQSYTDLWELVKLSGYRLIFIDQIKPESDNTYIIATPDVNQEFVNNPKARIIYWLLEWYGDYYQREGIAETWVSNLTFAGTLKDKGNIRFVPMGSHAGLGAQRGGEYFDVAHMSYDGIHRRSLIFGQMVERGIKIAPNGWGQERDFRLRNTRMMAHIHQDHNYPAIAPLRASLAAAYHLPLLCESGWDITPYEGVIMQAEYPSLVDAAQRALKKSTLQQWGDKLFQRLCRDLRFDIVVEGAL
jgi:hypothetical protein